MYFIVSVKCPSCHEDWNLYTDKSGVEYIRRNPAIVDLDDYEISDTTCPDCETDLMKEIK